MSAVSRKELDEAQEKGLHYNNGGAFNNTKTDEGGVYVSMQLPSVIAATVGGGTMLATQKECLQIMGCHGKVKILCIVTMFFIFIYLGSCEEAC